MKTLRIEINDGDYKAGIETPLDVFLAAQNKYAELEPALNCLIIDYGNYTSAARP